jgi:predicted HTH domain antitoxin
MNISFEIPQDLEQHIRTDGGDLSQDAKEVYLMEQYRQAKLSHRQLAEALGFSFQQTAELLKRRGLGQDIDVAEFEASRERFRKARPQ